MARTLETLASKMQSLKKKIPSAVNDATIRFTLDVVTELSFRTPADTSKALSNWRVKIGSPVKKKSREPYVRGVRASTRIASAEQTVSAANLALKGRKFGQIIYISNNVSYLRDLNDGSSLQAPAGFIDIASRAAWRRFKRTGIDYGRRKI